MKIYLATIITCLLCYGSINAQAETGRAAVAPAGNTKKTAPASPEVNEAARLNAQVVELYKESKYDEALPLAERVLTLREHQLDPMDRRIADALTNLASVYEAKKENGKAEPLYQRALTIYETAAGPDSDSGAAILNRLVVIKFSQGSYDKAETFDRRLLEIKEKKLGADNVGLAVPLTNLAYIYAAKDNMTQARAAFARVLTILEKAAPAALPAGMSEPLANYLSLLYRQRQTDEVKAQIERTNKILIAVATAGGGGKSVQAAGVLNGRAVLKPQPDYPMLAKINHAQGVVVVEIVVDETGKVIKAEAVSNSDPSLKVAAVKAALQARFTPTLLSGVPVKVSGIITYNFALR
jgi:TonB family protein